MSPAEQNFAGEVLARLRQKDARAAALVQRGGPRSKGVPIGIVDQGEFVPLLKLDAASAACNVLSLFVRHHELWMPTLQRGTPAMLADLLAGPFSYLWTIAVTALDDGDPSV